MHAYFFSGFPASDHSLHVYWSKRVTSQALAFFRVHAFLKALFDRTKEVVEDLYREGADESTIVVRFREYMTKGQTMRSQGPKRVEFYNDVTSIAQKVTEFANCFTTPILPVLS